MNIVVIDGQSGRMGQLFIEKARAAGIAEPITAIGTNALATAAMLKAGATQGATGENPVLVACRSADIIVGPIGILVADAMLGEITPEMALAVGRSGAKKLLLPVNQCGNLVAGTQVMSLSKVMEEAVELLRTLCTQI
jgi:prephenate dehydrogenase